MRGLFAASFLAIGFAATNPAGVVASTTGKTERQCEAQYAANKAVIKAQAR